MHRSNLPLLLAALASCAATPGPTPPARAPQPLDATEAEGRAGTAPVEPLARWEEMLEPYGGDREVVAQRLLEVSSAFREAQTSTRSMPRQAGGRTFWTEIEGERSLLVIHEASGDDGRRIDLPALQRSVARTPYAPIPDPTGAYVAVWEGDGAEGCPWAILEAERGRPIGRVVTGPPDLFGPRERISRVDPLSWSPDGRSLLVTAGTDWSSIDRVDLATNTHTRLWTTPDGTPIRSWREDPGGSALLAVTKLGGLYRIDLDGGPARLLLEDVERVVGTNGRVVWVHRTSPESGAGVQMLDLLRPGASPSPLLPDETFGVRAAALIDGRLLIDLAAPPRVDDRPDELLVCWPSGEVAHRIPFLDPVRCTAFDSGARGSDVTLEVLDGSDTTSFWTLDLDRGQLSPMPAPFASLRLHSEGVRGERMASAALDVALPAESSVPQVTLQRFDHPIHGWDRHTWAALGGQLNVVGVAAAPPTSGPPTEPLDAFAARLIELGLQPRADVVDRLRARGDL